MPGLAGHHRPARRRPASTEAPIAVVTANRVVACSHAARAAGVRRGLRRREAQARCPELSCCPATRRPRRASSSRWSPRSSRSRPASRSPGPGLAAIGVRGPTRYFGGETGVLHALSRAVAGTSLGRRRRADRHRRRCLRRRAGRPARRDRRPPAGRRSSWPTCRSRRSTRPATSPLIDLLRRLGIRTLGAFAALPARDVLARFGPDGRVGAPAGRRTRRPAGGRAAAAGRVHRHPRPRAAGRPGRHRRVLRPRRRRAVRRRPRRARAGLHLPRTAGAVRERRGDGAPLAARRGARPGRTSSTGCAGSSRAGCPGRTGPPAASARLRLVPIETVPTGAHQQALWGGVGRGGRAGAPRAGPGADPARARLGARPGARRRPRPGQRTRLVPWGDEPVPRALAGAAVAGPAAGARAVGAARPAASGAGARRDGRTGRGHRARRDAGAARAVRDRRGEKPVAITSWAGPWPVDERWWNADGGAAASCRCQVVDVAAGPTWSAARCAGRASGRWTRSTTEGVSRARSAASAMPLRSRRDPSRPRGPCRPGVPGPSPARAPLPAQALGDRPAARNAPSVSELPCT